MYRKFLILTLKKNNQIHQIYDVLLYDISCTQFVEIVKNMNVCIVGLEHHFPQLADLCPVVGSLLYLDGAPFQKGLSPVFSHRSLLWRGFTRHSVCVWHESQGTARRKQWNQAGRNWIKKIYLPMSSVGITGIQCEVLVRSVLCYQCFLFYILENSIVGVKLSDQMEQCELALDFI